MQREIIDSAPPAATEFSTPSPSSMFENCTPELSELWRGVPVPESWKRLFLNLSLPASSSVSIGTPLSPWDPPSRIAESKIESRKWPSAGKFWHHEVAAFCSKAKPLPQPCLSPRHHPTLITRPLNIKIQSKTLKDRVPKGKGGGRSESLKSLKSPRNTKGNQ